ncbi:MAG: hypothetical protein JWO89_1792, partial [Verrucomicrobiaceae bacterium]|nr:hypothetical protein [Verrucomicrobiaceae bacterium]
MSFSVRSVFFLPVFIAAAASFSALPLARADIVGTDWTVRNPVRLHSDMLDMAVNGSSNLVAVGAHGAIVSGSDPSALARVPTGVTDDFSSVTFGGGRYYTVGNRGHILSSTNSTTWTVKYSSTTDIFESVATSGSLVVAAGAYFNSATASYNNVVVTSTDGVNWTRRVFPNMAPITRMLWNGQMFVGILDGATASSLDGSSWSIHPLPPATATGTAATRSIVWTGNTYLVSGDTVWKSFDGVVWTEYAALLNGSSGAYLSWTGNELLIGLGSRIYSSTDLVNVLDRSTGQLSPATYGVRFGSSIVMAGAGGHVDSQDATGTWSPRFSAGLTSTIRGIAKSPNLYVAVGVGVTWTSPDGNNWTEHAQSGKNFISAAWSGSQFVASGSGVWTSPDGITWTNAIPVDTNAQQVWTMVTWVGGKGYASGYDYANGVALNKTSLDGTTWSTGALTRTVLGMAKNTDGSRLLAVGVSGTAMYSIDNGSTWQGGAIDLGGQDFNDVTFGAGKYVAVTSGGSIWSTLDGQSWDRLSAGSGVLNSVTRATNEFIAVGSSGRVLRSFDGKSWRFAESKTSSTLARVLFTNNRLIAAGASGNIISSDGDLPVQTTVQFATTTSSMTEGGSVGVVVTLSQESTISATVTLNYTGSATSAEFGGPGTTVTIPAGETSAFMVFTATDNNTISTTGDKTLVITLGSPFGDVALGAPSELVHTITIHDNDVVPAFDVQPADQLAALGQPVVFTAHATGSGNLAYQWKKNGVAITNAKSESLTIAKAALTDAASYTVTVTGNVGQPVTCTAAKLGVVTVQNLTQVVKAGGTASFPSTVKLPTGAQVTYQWRKGAQPLSIGGRTTDAAAKLTFTGVVAGDTDTYVCDVTLGSGIGAPMMTATTVDYTVLGTVPVITQPAPLQTRVAATIDFTPVATGRPTSWTATPLPPGVVFNATTGRISGKFSKAGQYNVKFTGTN